MRLPSKRSAPLIALVFALALAGCESADERAEGHYQRALELVAAGDVERAMVEFRNVFQLNGDHTEARLAYAGILREQGKPREAYSQYLRLVEQDPDSLDGRKQVAELAISFGNLDEAEPHIKAAYAMAPEDPQVRALKATLDYATGDRPAAVTLAQDVLADDPAQVPAHLILIAEQLNAGDYRAALPLIETALAQAPQDEALNLLKLSTLENLGERAAMGVQLEKMVALFPENEGFAQAFVRWHMQEGDLDGAEAILRDLAAKAPEDEEATFRVVQFLLETRGAEAARTELTRLADSETNPAPFQRALAVLDYSEGKTEEAVAGMRRLIEGSEPSAERRDTQAALAQMLAEEGDVAGRDALVDEILSEDALHVEALKLRARRQIDADQPDLAVQDMRTALEKAPRDAEILTLMAEAHEREGSRDLAGERLALAVEASNRGPAESIRYARFMMQDNRLGPAESVVVDALRLDPQNRDLLVTLGEIHLQRRDWARATQVAEALRGLEDPAAARAADRIEATALRSQNRTDETIAMLRGMLEADDQDIRALASLAQTYVEAGDMGAARDLIGEQLAENPESVPLRMMQAGILAAEGKLPEAEALYREIIADAPQERAPYRTLFALLNAQERGGDAETMLDAGIAATDDPNLRFTKAALLELREDFEGAIALYEGIYAQNSGSDVVANNLASLLTTQRSDAESLERAFTIARRLRSSNVPYYQDTYGWILTRRGDPEQALSFLEPAASALPENEQVQAHLGMTYAALERWDAARTALERAVELAGPQSTLPQITEARSTLAEIPAAAAESEAEAEPETEAEAEAGAAGQ